MRKIRRNERKRSIDSNSNNFFIFRKFFNNNSRLEFHKKLFSFVPRQTIGSMYLKMHLNFIWTLKLPMSALLCSIKLINLRLTYDMNLLYYPTHSASYFLDCALLNSFGLLILIMYINFISRSVLTPSAAECYGILKSVIYHLMNFMISMTYP